MYLVLGRLIFLVAACPKFPRGYDKVLAESYEVDEKKVKQFSRSLRSALQGKHFPSTATLEHAVKDFGEPFFMLDLLMRRHAGAPPLPFEEVYSHLLNNSCPEINNSDADGTCKAYIMEVDKCIFDYMEAIKSDQVNRRQLLADMRLPCNIKDFLADVKTPQNEQPLLWLNLFVFYLAISETVLWRRYNVSGAYEELLKLKEKTFIKQLQRIITKAVRRKRMNKQWLIERWYNAFYGKKNVDLDEKLQQWKRYQKPDKFVDPKFLEALCMVYGPLVASKQYDAAKEEGNKKGFHMCFLIMFQSIVWNAYILDFLNNDNPKFRPPKRNGFKDEELLNDLTLHFSKRDFDNAVSKFDNYIDFLKDKIVAQDASVD